MKIAMAQASPVTGALTTNTSAIVNYILQARERQCDLILTPETCITGYMSCDLLEVDSYLRDNRRLLLEQIVPATQNITAVVGFVDYREVNGRITDRYNAAAVIQNRQILGTAHKRCLCRYRFFDETRYYTSGNSTLVLPVQIGEETINLSPIICEDLWDDNYDISPFREAADKGASLVTVLNASHFEPDKWDRRLKLVRHHQSAHPIPIVYTNTTGIGDNLKGIIPFDGRSMAFDGRGRMVATGPFFEEGLVTCKLGPGGQSTPIQPPCWNEDEELHTALTFTLRKYCEITGFDRLVLGMSGGVDSSLCAALAAEAMGPSSVRGLTLPSRHNSSETREDAEECCANLGVQFDTISIDDLYSRTRDTFEKWKTITNGVTAQNFQARLRGLLLMGISNETGRMVLATGNKTELGLGYCTLYGDMVGGMLLIGDVNKNQVYQLTEFINARAGSDIIPSSVIQRAPSAELTADQSDPFDYPVVAPLVDDLIARKDPTEILRKFRNRGLDKRYPNTLYEQYDENDFANLLRDIQTRYHNSAFKRSQASPLVIVSRRALGFDLRETIINKWNPLKI
ncbi:MAG: NAD(+) synthase [Planctomycetota bacterium]